MTFGAGNAIYFASSADGGTTFSQPVKVGEDGKSPLGRHRGPRIAFAGKTIVISAVVGEKGGGADGDILAYRSTDNGKSWSKGVAVNHTRGAAREGLHSMAGRLGRTPIHGLRRVWPERAPPFTSPAARRGRHAAPELR